MPPTFFNRQIIDRGPSAVNITSVADSPPANAACEKVTRVLPARAHLAVRVSLECLDSVTKRLSAALRTAANFTLHYKVNDFIVAAHIGEVVCV